ncbi:MAG: Asp-tRNA(Asn)/Glu-tRNA(Gln) amidotransferase subunit GatC [Candidatus Margulisbacteria bacterium]|nr:Asp-tRNA(Asn)/Glu-tRNA(Gln) amidotransferase subunit GatC [Candidatus Margulisiibacteriota bacterium]
MTLSSEDLEKVLALSHLEIDAQEKDLYLTQLHSVLKYMGVLNQLDLSCVEPASQMASEKLLQGEDVVTPFHDGQYIPENAPEWEEGSFRVPKIHSGDT